MQSATAHASSLAVVMAVFVVAANAAAQDPAAIEASLALDRPVRRVIQQGLNNEGFDPGAPDGLFGPRTRAAIRAWQASRDHAETGYLDRAQAEALRAAGSPRASEPRLAPASTPPSANTSTAPAVAQASAAALPLATDAPPSGAETVEPAALGVVESLAPAEAVPGPEGNARGAQTARSTQLPPQILIDRRLVRVERLLAEDDHWAAYDVMNEIVALHREHGLALPAAFHFNYAQVAFAAGIAETAVVSLNEYLLTAGRNGEFYLEALELLDSAEEAVRRADAERRRAETARQRAAAERRRVAARQRENDALAHRQTEVAAILLPRDSLRSGGLAPQMVTVAPGRFQYFTARERNNRWWEWEHTEWVTFDRPFAIGKYEVTRGDFEHFVDRARYRTEARRDPEYGCRAYSKDRRNSSFRWNRPGFDQTDRHPVTCVSIRDAMAYARWLSEETGHTYRLPSAAEWQYATRAGSPQAMLYIRVDDEPEVPDICRFAHVEDCYSGTGSTVEVGRLRPNAIGLHDMIGNVDEIVSACMHYSPDDNITRWGGNLTTHGQRENPEACTYRVATMGDSWAWRRFTRGASYRGTDSLPVNTKSPYVRNSQNWSGFRLVRELQSPDDVQ